MHPTRPKQPSIPLRDQILQEARAAKRGLDNIIRPLAVDRSGSAMDSPEYWDQMWKTAHFLRLKADALGVRAQREGRRLREEAHPANQPESEQGGQ